MQTIKQFIVEQGLRMDVDTAESNPHMNGMPNGSRHYRCTIKQLIPETDIYGGFTIEIPFSCGPAIKDAPSLEDVLDCLASDAASVENCDDWVAFAFEMGMNTETEKEFREAESTWYVIEEQAGSLRLLLGDKGYEALLYETERE